MNSLLRNLFWCETLSDAGKTAEIVFFSNESNVHGLFTGLQRHIAFSDSLFISIPPAAG